MTVDADADGFCIAAVPDALAGLLGDVEIEPL
jgi:hypothetical protein